MEDCVFCRIIKGVVPASLVYEDEKVVAIMDTQPVNLGHVLIIPKVHAAQLAELEEETGTHTCSRLQCVSLKLLGVQV